MSRHNSYNTAIHREGGAVPESRIPFHSIQPSPQQSSSPTELEIYPRREGNGHHLASDDLRVSSVGGVYNAPEQPSSPESVSEDGSVALSIREESLSSITGHEDQPGPTRNTEHRSESSLEQFSVAYDPNEATEPGIGAPPVSSHHKSQSDTKLIGTALSQSKPSVLCWWYIDILAIATAVASLAAIIGVLLAYDGQYQDKWAGKALTINGLIAILATICRGALMTSVASVLSQEKWNRFAKSTNKLEDFAIFDEASRGLWGSLQFFWNLRALHVGYLGALLTILSLAFSTFSQQLITFRVDQIPDGPQSGIGGVERASYVNTAYGFGYPSTATRIAMYNGFMSTQIANSTVICPTGNCTWPVTPTIGVCGACMDVTDAIEYHRSPSSFCVLSLDNLNMTGYCDSDLLDYGQVFTVGPGSGRIFTSLADEDIQANSPNLIADFSAIGLPLSKSLSTGLDDAQASECALWYCLQAHNVSVTLGELHDTTVGTWSRARSPTPEANITFSDVPATMNIAPDDTYEVSYTQAFAMSSWAKNNFTGLVNADSVTGVIAPSSDFADGMHRGFDAVDEWITRLSTSMTNEIRQNTLGSVDDSQYQGTIYTSQIVIHVRWLWIIFPACLVVLSAVYLVVEIIHTSSLDIKPWKSDSLLPIYAQLDSGLISTASHGSMEPDGVKKSIGMSRVRLIVEDGKPLGFA